MEIMSLKSFMHYLTLIDINSCLKHLNLMPSKVVQQYNRIPLVYKGSIMGGGYGVMGASPND